MFVFIDSETTGLDHKTHRILELGLVVTTDDLTVIAQSSWVRRYRPRPQPNSLAVKTGRLDQRVFDMHEKSGLWNECAASELLDSDIEHGALRFLENVGVPRGEVPLAGNTVGFDRMFLAEWMPGLLNYFHYRSLDVSSFGIEASMRYPEVFASRPHQDKGVAAHRVIKDIEASIDQLKHYRREMFR